MFLRWLFFNLSFASENDLGRVHTHRVRIAGYFRPCLAYRLNIQCHHRVDTLWTALSPQSACSQKHVYLSYLLGKQRLCGISQINLSLLWRISGLHNLHYMHILFTVISMAFHTWELGTKPCTTMYTSKRKTSPKVIFIVCFHRQQQATTGNSR